MSHQVGHTNRQERGINLSLYLHMNAAVALFLQELRITEVSS